MGFHNSGGRTISFFEEVMIFC
jgi:hypothetical protein